MGSGGKHGRSSEKTHQFAEFRSIVPSPTPPLPASPRKQICYEGEHLACLLKSIKRAMESARLMDASLPLRIWLKQNFSLGINEVTRVLERMPTNPTSQRGISRGHSFTCQSHQNMASPVQLQVILLASDCHPQWLTRHLFTIAPTRKVPLILVKDKKMGSVKLGDLVKLRTAVAVGIKVKGSVINQLMEEILSGAMD
ncbi:hypothetical protein NMG60_11013719 [Bertholletia excelsa]